MKIPGLSDILDRLLEQLDPQVAAANSYQHFHVRGLVYLNLLRSLDLTAKLYLIDPRVVEPQCGSFLVNPHDHAYRFQTLVAAGECTNHTSRRTEGETFVHHAFHSALNGPSQIVTQGRCGLTWESLLTMRPGEGYACDERTIHTISVHPTRPTVLFLLQYKDIRTPTALYTREPAPPSLEGLYERLTPEQVSHYAEIARTYIAYARSGITPPGAFRGDIFASPGQIAGIRRRVLDAVTHGSWRHRYPLEDCEKTALLLQRILDELPSLAALEDVSMEICADVLDACEDEGVSLPEGVYAHFRIMRRPALKRGQ